MTNFDSHFIREVLQSGPDRSRQLISFSGCTVDSRSATAGSLFVAMKGELLDGHDFILDAANRGARGAICDKNWQGSVPSDFVLYPVKDPFDAFRQLAFAWRGQLSCPIIAVAGSVGKTTSKELLAAMLRGRYSRISATRGSENGFIGIPLTLLNCPRDAEVLVVEIGIDTPGAMALHMELVRPTAGVVTACAAEHLETLKDMETVAREESLCLQWLAGHEGIVALNLDDPWLARLVPELQTYPRLYTYELGGKQLGSKRHLAARMIDNQLRLTGLGAFDDSFKVPLIGEHNARNAAAAALLALVHGLSAQEIAHGIKSFVPNFGRSLLKRTRSGTRVFCDFYNASPASMVAAFRTVAALPRDQGRLIACLGDMLELGEQAEQWHKDLVPTLRECGFAAVYGYGTHAPALAQELMRGPQPLWARAFSAIEDLMRDLSESLTPEDIVLIKGSRGMRMERVWQALESL